MRLIADSGSTKTHWSLGGRLIRTAGINPVRDDADAIRLVVDTLPEEPAVTEIHFFGAGCIEPYAGKVRDCLHDRYPQADITVESDMLGAARALCGHDEGVACILGTGSNSCLWDGEGIVQNTPAMGYILGDEGSGAVLGRLLVGEVFKGQLDEGLREDFMQAHGLTMASVIERVYRQPMANRFLASLVPWLANHMEEARLRDMVVREFRNFLRRNVVAYDHPGLPIHFTGGVASHLSEALEEAVLDEGLRMGQIIEAPINELVKYYED